MRAHVVTNSVITNTIVIEALDTVPGLNLIDASIGGVIGDLYSNGVFTRPPPKPPVIPKIDLNSLTEAEKQSLINLVRVRP